jgi:tagatose 1,6-diphosphate aldolase
MMTTMRGFRFLSPGALSDDGLHLLLTERFPADWPRGRAPSYSFTMYAPRAAPHGEEAGNVSLRIGDECMLYLFGHIGYNVSEAFRGRRFAGRACRLLFPLARKHGLETLWITCDPDNIPSRRTCEWLGAELIETVPVPREHVLHACGQRAKCRYRLRIGA